MVDHGLELLLAYHGRRHFLATGHYLKFDVKIVEASSRVPHGLSYSLTLHSPDNRRLLGFDNAHLVKHQGSRFVSAPCTADHWHRTEHDEGRPYQFRDAVQLLIDFFEEVERKLRALDIPSQIVGETCDGDT